MTGQMPFALSSPIPTEEVPEEAKKVAACANALATLRDHVGFSTFMNALMSILEESQKDAKDEEFESYVRKMETNLWGLRWERVKLSGELKAGQ